MGSQIETCQWNSEPCSNAATLHMNWLLDNGDRRDRHLCEVHAEDVREQNRDTHEQLISTCGPSCPIVFDNASRDNMQ